MAKKGAKVPKEVSEEDGLSPQYLSLSVHFCFPGVQAIFEQQKKERRKQKKPAKKYRRQENVQINFAGKSARKAAEAADQGQERPNLFKGGGPGDGGAGYLSSD